MAGKWRECLLGDVIELKRGYDLPERERRAGSVPIISSSGPSGFHDQAKVKGPGVVTGRYGTIGQVFYVHGDFWPLNTTLYVRDFKGNDPRFVSYFLRGLNYLAYSDKAAVPGLNRNHLHQAAVRFPEDLDEQRAIAHILGTLDDKIELNRRMSETLEAMARALFKAWFVDFEPVRAKCRGAPGCSPVCTPVSSGQTQRSAPTGWQWPQHILDLFPDRLVDSELGEIPEGWEIVTLGQLMELAYGRALKEEDRRPGRVPVYGSNGQVGWHDEVLGAGPGIVVGRKGNPGTVTWVQVDFFAIDTTFYVVPKEKCRSIYFLFFALSNQDLPSLAADSAIPGLNRNFVYSNLQVIPPPAVLNAFDEVIKALFNRRYLNECESRTLAALRDTLLPKLISGELRVKEAEKLLRRASV